MPYKVLKLPEFPEKVIFISFFSDLESDVIRNVKEELIAGNSDFDFCFLNTDHIVSMEHLNYSIHQSIVNFKFGAEKAKTLNTEIILNLSPTNNITDSLKRFGVSGDCPNLIAIKVLETHSEVPEKVNEHLNLILRAKEQQNIEFDNDVLFDNFVNIQKVKKIYKLSDAQMTETGKQQQARLTRLVIGACILRGH